MFSLDSLQVMIAADGGVLCVCDGVIQAPSARKIIKEVKQRQPCYLTLVIYDRTEEPPVSDNMLLPMPRVCSGVSSMWRICQLLHHAPLFDTGGSHALQVAVGRMQISLTEMLNLQVMLLVPPALALSLNPPPPQPVGGHLAAAVRRQGLRCW